MERWSFGMWTKKYKDRINHRDTESTEIRREEQCWPEFEHNYGQLKSRLNFRIDIQSISYLCSSMANSQ
jgi:hypothetical protein